MVALGALFALVEPAGSPQVYVEAVTDEPPLLNPILAPYTLAGQDMLPLVFSGLVKSDPRGNLTPDLAENWEVSPDGRTYTFRMRDGLRWHDATPLEAADVAFTVSLIQSTGHQGSQELADLWRGVEVAAVDRLTVRFNLPEPLASFPDHLTLGLLPRHALEGVAAQDLPLHELNRAPIGSGPFRVSSMSPERIVLERFEAYAGPSARLDQIELRFFDDREPAVRALLRGEVDGIADVRPEENEQIESTGRLTLYSAPERAKVAMLSLNTRSDLFRDRTVRLALGMAIDRAALVSSALPGLAEPAVGPIPVQSWAYAAVASAYDPAGAARLLDAAGWRTGPSGFRERDGLDLRCTLLTADSPDRVAAARELSAQLSRVGVSMDVRPLPADELTEEYLETRQFEAALVGQWAMGSDPDVYPQWHSSQAARLGGNYAGFSDPDVDRWLEVGRQRLDLGERRNAYLHFQARWAEEQPSVVLYHPLFNFAVSKAIWGVAADAVPDSGWRLRQAVSWYRPVRATPLQRMRATVEGWLVSKSR